MKKPIKELLNMSMDDIFKICSGNCITQKYCPFAKKWYKYRQDGYCIAETFRNIPGWIEADEYEIENLKWKIQNIKNRIAKYKKFQKAVEKETK